MLLKWGLKIRLERSRHSDLRLKFISLLFCATEKCCNREWWYSQCFRLWSQWRANRGVCSKNGLIGLWAIQGRAEDRLKLIFSISNYVLSRKLSSSLTKKKNPPGSLEWSGTMVCVVPRVYGKQSAVEAERTSLFPHWGAMGIITI